MTPYRYSQLRFLWGLPRLVKWILIGLPAVVTHCQIKAIAQIWIHEGLGALLTNRIVTLNYWSCKTCHIHTHYIMAILIMTQLTGAMWVHPNLKKEAVLPGSWVIFFTTGSSSSFSSMKNPAPESTVFATLALVPPKAHTHKIKQAIGPLRYGSYFLCETHFCNYSVQSSFRLPCPRADEGRLASRACLSISARCLLRSILANIKADNGWGEASDDWPLDAFSSTSPSMFNTNHQLLGAMQKMFSQVVWKQKQQSSALWTQLEGENPIHA